jgi:hypothetical protein
LAARYLQHSAYIDIQVRLQRFELRHSHPFAGHLQVSFAQTWCQQGFYLFASLAAPAVASVLF